MLMKPSENIRAIGAVHDNYESGFFEKLFGTGNETIVRRFAAQWGREVTDGGFFGDDSLQFTYRGFRCAIIPRTDFDSATNVTNYYLDFVADYVPADGFQLRIESEGLWSALCAMFGHKDFEIGDANFDKAFELDSSDDPRLKKICDQAGLKSAMLRAGSCELTTMDPGWFSDTPEGKRRLRYRIQGEIENVQALNQQLQAFGDMLDGLVSTGCVKN